MFPYVIFNELDKLKHKVFWIERRAQIRSVLWNLKVKCKGVVMMKKDSKKAFNLSKEEAK